MPSHRIFASSLSLSFSPPALKMNASFTGWRQITFQFSNGRRFKFIIYVRRMALNWLAIISINHICWFNWWNNRLSPCTRCDEINDKLSTSVNIKSMFNRTKDCNCFLNHDSLTGVNDEMHSFEVCSIITPKPRT